MLQFVLHVSQHERIRQVLDSDSIDVDIPVISRMSNVFHLTPRAPRVSRRWPVCPQTASADPERHARQILGESQDTVLPSGKPGILEISAAHKM
jgi:hypothetical protein